MTRLQVSESCVPPQCIVSEAARVPPSEEEVEGEHDQSDRFWDPRSRTSFKFDHLALVRLHMYCSQSFAASVN